MATKDALVIALEKGNGRVEMEGGEEKKPLPKPRPFEFSKEELGVEVSPGDRISGEWSGVVKAVNDEGMVMANILSINGNAPQTEEEEEPEAVETGTSLMPGGA